MRRSSFLRLAAGLFAFAFLTPAPGIELPPFFPITPEAPAQETRAQEPAITLPEPLRLGRDFARTHAAWYRRVLAQPFAARQTGAAWDEAARKFVDEAILWEAKPRTPQLRHRTGRLAGDGRKLIKEGCEDPLVLYLTAMVAYAASDDWRPSSDLLERARKQAPAVQPRALGFLIELAWATVRTRGKHKAEGADKQALAALREALADGSYAAEDDVILVHQLCTGLATGLRDRRPDDMAALYATAAPALVPWAREALLGRTEIDRAWDKRGGGYADSVTDEGWQGFKHHLRQARAHLERGWQLRPDRPEAATNMITVVMAGARENGDTVRRWLDRAIAAEWDYQPAYDAAMWAYRPRWGGSHARMLALGRACLETRRWDTEVPFLFTKACNDIVSEIGDWRPFYRRPEIAGPLLELSHAVVAEPSRVGEREMRLGYLAVNAWLVADYATSAATLATLAGMGKPTLHAEAAAKVRSHGSNEGEFRTEVAIGASPARAAWEEAQALSARGERAGARAAFAGAAAEAGEPAAAALRAEVAILDTEAALEDGQWHRLPTEPGLPVWSLRAGSWHAEPDGTLVAKGTDRAGLLLHRARVGADFELCGEWETDAPKGCCRLLGIAMGWNRDQREQWTTCSIGQGGKAPIKAALKDRHYGTGDEGITVALQPVNRFYVRAEDDRFTLHLNGAVVYDRHEPETLDFGDDHGRVGFAGWNFCRHNTLRIRGVYVRRLLK